MSTSQGNTESGAQSPKVESAATGFWAYLKQDFNRSFTRDIALPLEQKRYARVCIALFGVSVVIAVLLLLSNAILDDVAGATTSRPELHGFLKGRMVFLYLLFCLTTWG